VKSTVFLQLIVHVSPDSRIHGYRRIFFSPEYFFVGHIFFRVNWLWMCISRRKFAWPYFTRTCARTREVNYTRCIQVSSPHYGILQEFISLWFGWSRSLSKLVENMAVEESKFCYGKKGSVWNTRHSTLGGRL